MRSLLVSLIGFCFAQRDFGIPSDQIGNPGDDEVLVFNEPSRGDRLDENAYAEQLGSDFAQLLQNPAQVCQESFVNVNPSIGGMFYQARAFLNIADAAKLSDLLWHDEFLNLTVHDVLTMSNSLLAEFNVKWCHDALGMITQLQDTTAVEKVEGITQYLNGVLGDLTTTSQVGHFKDFVSRISLYLTTPVTPIDDTNKLSGDHPIRQFFEFLAAGQSEETLALVYNITNALNLNALSNVTSRNDVCSIIEQTIREQYGPLASVVQGTLDIWLEYFSNRRYDSYAGGITSIYAFVRHFLTDEASCTTMVNDLYKLGSQAVTEYGEMVAAQYSNFNPWNPPSPVTPALELMDKYTGGIGKIYYTWLESDKTQPLDRNAVTAWLIETTWFEQLFRMLPKLYKYLKSSLGRREEYRFAFEIISQIGIDMDEMSAQQTRMQRSLRDLGVCGNIDGNCTTMTTLRQTYPSVSAESKTTSSILLITIITVINLFSLGN